MGNAMIKKHQISSFDRVGISGYIMYNWEVIGRQYTGEELARIESFCSNFSRKALFVTAFFFPEDPIEDAKIYHLLPIHGTPEEKKEYSEFLINKKNRNVAYAKRYLQNIIDYALNHKDVGLLVKLHPVEISEGNMEITKIYETLSFTGTAVMLLAAGWCLINCLVNRFEILNRIIDLLMIVMSTVFSFGMFIIVSLTGTNENLDAALYKYTTGRSQVSYNMMNVYPIKLFGQRLDGRTGYEIVDNAYVYTLIQLGLIMFCLMVIAYLCCIINAYKYRVTRRLFIMAIFIAYGFMEQSFINPFINFSWLFIADMIWCEEI